MVHEILQGKEWLDDTYDYFVLVKFLKFSAILFVLSLKQQLSI